MKLNEEMENTIFHNMGIMFLSESMSNIDYKDWAKYINKEFGTESLEQALEFTIKEMIASNMGLEHLEEVAKENGFELVTKGDDWDLHKIPQRVYEVDSNESALDWIRYSRDLAQVKEFIEDEIEARDEDFTYEEHLAEVRYNRSVEEGVKDDKIVFDIIDSFIEKHMNEEIENQLKFEDLENTLDRYLNIDFKTKEMVSNWSGKAEITREMTFETIDELRGFLCTEMVRDIKPILIEWDNGLVEIKVPFGELGGGIITNYTLKGRVK